MLEAAEHIRMARAQQTLYRAKIDAARMSVDRPHSERTYTFVVDYGQNMELPVFNKEQPGCTYYYSPMTVNNLGMVDHAHKYPDGTVGEHMHCHVSRVYGSCWEEGGKQCSIAHHKDAEGLESS